LTLPNFIVIGAAKAGTTALYWYLVEHPAVFMSRVKETNYFAYGLDGSGRLLYGDPEMHRYPVTSLREYELLFADAGDATAIGEASPIYLECPQASARIREQLPSVRIICGLRQPVDRAYSDYQMYLRARGRRLDPARDLTAGALWAQPDSHWMRIGRYYEQLLRYFNAFPRARIHVFLSDDLGRSPERALRQMYRFLEVDDGFIPDLATPHNIGGMPASRLLERLFTSRVLRSAVGPWIPEGAANWVRRFRTRTMREAPLLPRELRAELTNHFRDDILRTSELIGHDLAHWL
jgi:hypothetical protein